MYNVVQGMWQDGPEMLCEKVSGTLSLVAFAAARSASAVHLSPLVTPCLGQRGSAFMCSVVERLSMFTLYVRGIGWR
jgi:hypothetical protein